MVMDLSPINENQYFDSYDLPYGLRSVLMDGVIVPKDPDGSYDIGIAGVELMDDVLVELVVQFERTSTTSVTGLPDFRLYSTIPGNLEDAWMYWLGEYPRGRATNQVSFLIGPGSGDFRNALEASVSPDTGPETGLVLRVTHAKITGFVWRYLPANGPVGALTPGDAPLLPVDVVSSETPQGTSAGPGLRYLDDKDDFYDERYAEGNARWWRFVPEETGWYSYSTELSRLPAGPGATWDNSWSFASAYVFDGVPGADGLPISWSAYDRPHDAYEANGLVHLTAGRTYYIKVMNQPYYTQYHSVLWRLLVQRATWFCGDVGPDQFQAKEIPDPDHWCSDPVANYSLVSDYYWERPHSGWWTFVADRSGPFQATAQLSEWRDSGEPVTVNGSSWLRVALLTNDEYWTGSTNPLHLQYMSDFVGSPDGESSDWDWLEEGKRYWLMVAPYHWSYDRPISYVLQTSWVDWEPMRFTNEVVFSRDDANIGRSIVPSNQAGQSWSEGFTDLNPYWNIYNSPIEMMGFQGHAEAWRGFAGPMPGDPTQNEAAFSCLWPKARRGEGGSFWWTGGNVVDWRDPGPPATCPAYIPVPGRMEQSYADAPVGYHVSSDYGTYGQMEIRAWCMAQNISFHWLTYVLGINVGLSSLDMLAQAAEMNPRPNPQFGGNLFYWTGEYRNSQYPRGGFIQKAEVAADGGGNQWANPGLCPPTEWFLLESRWWDQEDESLEGFGPWGVRRLPRFSGGPEGSEHVAALGVKVGETSGEASPWVEVDWQRFWDREEALAAEWGGDPGDFAGATAIGTNAHMMSDAMPVPPPTVPPDVEFYVARLNQVLAWKFSLLSREQMVWWFTPFEGLPGPVGPDCPWEWPGPAIDGEYVDDRREFRRL